MSLNRCEQRVFDYIQSQVDEGHFWKQKVQKICSAAGSGFYASAVRLESELWHYYVERSEVTPVFQEAARLEGLRRSRGGRPSPSNHRPDTFRRKPSLHVESGQRHQTGIVQRR